MNGSYSVPIGSSRSPLIVCDKPERRQQDEQIHLGDAELDVLALGRELPIESRRDALALERVGHRLAREQPAAVHPGPRLVETVTSGDVGDDARGEFAVAAADLVEDRAEAGLRRHHRLESSPAIRPAPRSRGAFRRRPPAAANGTRSRNACSSFRRQRKAFELVPFVAGPHAHGGAEGFHLRRRHQAGMVVLVAGERQAEALDRVADETGRPVVIDAVRTPRAPPADRGRRDCSSAAPVRRRVRLSISRETSPWSPISSLQPLAPRRAAREHQRRIKLVRAVIDPVPAASRRPAPRTRPAAASRI